MPPSPLYSVPQPNIWRSSGTAPPGRTWTAPTPATSVKKKSPSYYRHSSERSKAWRDSWEITKLNISESDDSDSEKKICDKKEPAEVKEPETLETNLIYKSIVSQF